MIRYDEKRETCSCQVCRSDMAYIVPCLMTVPVGIVGSVSDIVTTARIEAVFPIPLLIG